MIRTITMIATKMTLGTNEWLDVVKAIIITVFLIFAAYHDLKTKRIPIPTFIVMTVICLGISIGQVVTDQDYKSFGYLFIGGIMMGLIFLVFALYKLVGGADVLMAAGLGFSVGFKMGFSILIIAEFLMMTYVLLKLLIKKEKTYVALAPYVLVAWVLTIAIYYIEGIVFY